MSDAAREAKSGTPRRVCLLIPAQSRLSLSLNAVVLKMINVGEFWAVIILLIVALVGSRLRSGWPTLQVWRDGVRWLSQPRVALLVVSGLSFSLNLAVGWTIHWPQPAVQDEFAYLLTADTFTHGRLTNPSHPLAEFFQTYHVFEYPTYQAKYPPGQGLALALGQWLTGEPIVGVWLSMAAASAAICWMLQGWVPRRWALLGGIVTAVHYDLITGWGQSYWGGGAALLAGALVYGTVPRLLREQRIRYGLLLASGLIILANTRPYEGMIAVLPAAWMLVRAWRRGELGATVRLWQRVGIPFSVTMLAALVGWCGYNHALTGEFWKMPYLHYWQVRSPNVPPSDLFIGTMHHQHQAVSAPPLVDRIFSFSYNRSIAWKLLRQWSFWVSPALVPALLIVLCTWRSRWTRLAGGTFLLVLFAAVSQGTWCHSHYLAPVGGLYIALVVQGFRWLRQWHFRGFPSGRWFAPALPVLFALATVQGLLIEWSQRPHPAGHAWSLRRAAVQAQLDRLAGRHLVLVRYSPQHVVHHEWVYNRADRDRAHVVWAHWAPTGQLAPLLAYYADRQIWMIEADAAEPQLVEFRVPRPRAALVKQSAAIDPPL